MASTTSSVRSPNFLILGVVILVIGMIASPFGLAVFALLGLSSDSSSSTSSVPQPDAVVNGPIPVPKQLIPVYEAAGEKYNVTWTVLAAIHYVETDFSMGNSPTSSAGAEGPMQFEPSTFATYGVTAPGQSGPPNIQNVYDAIYSTANYLSACGFAENPYGAIFQYNHASWYVQKVLNIANQIGSIPVQDYSSGGSVLGTSTYNKIMAEALKYQGFPYVYGGDNPSTSFDCSGLVQWVYGQVGIKLPRTAQEQYDATQHIPESDVKPGDLVFFSGTYDDGPGNVVTHVGIYVGGNMMYDADNSGIGYHQLSGYWMEHLYGFGRV